MSGTGTVSGGEGTSGTAPGQWRRVHPLSPLLRMWAVLVGVAAVVLAQQAESFRRLSDLLDDLNLPPLVLVPGALGALVLVFLLGWLVSLPWWRATGWRVDAEEIAVRRGVLSRSLRTARFDRVQAVDLVEPLAPRLFRLAGVKVETAGGSGSSVSVEYLPRAQAEELRSVLLGRVRGLTDATDDVALRAPGTVDAVVPGGARPLPGELPEGTEIVPPVPVLRSVVAAALTGPTAGTVLAVVISAATPAGLALLLPAVAGLGPWIWGLLNRSWRFTARCSGEEGDRLLGITFGFSERRRQSVPFSRIHAVEISQPLLWRLVGWWKVDVSIAGYGEPSSGGSTTAVLPVGTLDRALALVALLGPLDRAGVEALARPDGDGVRALSGSPVVRVYRSPASARWLSPWDLHRQGVALVDGPGVRDTGPTEPTGPAGPTAVVCHRGRLRRSVALIDPCHIQELTHRRGPLLRALGLAGVRFDLVPGPVSMAGRDLAAADAADLLTRLRGRRLPGSARPEAVPPVC